MATGRSRGKSDLFLVRLWGEEAENGATTWCGKVQRALTGEATSFQGWPELVDHLLAMLPVADGGRSSLAALALENPTPATGNPSDYKTDS